MHEALQVLIDRWRAEGIPLAKPMAFAESQRFFQSLPIPTGSDVWEFYSLCGGFKDEHLDKYNFTLWPPVQIEREASSSRPPLLPFADFLIDSHRYAIAKESAESSSVWLYHKEQPTSSYMISPTLSTFLHDYATARDPLGVLHDAC